jgi:hypothetical protein
MHRPQFAFSTPPECLDEAFSYYFDGFLTTALSLPAAQTVRGIPLRMQTDQPFLWRGVRIKAATGVVASLRFVDAFGNRLSDTIQSLDLTFSPSQLTNIGALAIAWEPELVCPPGAVILVDANNTGTAGQLQITLLGDKRYPRETILPRCA